MSLQDISDFARSFWGLWIMLIFIGIVIYAYWPKNKDRFKDYSEMPLRDDENEER